MKIKIVKRTSNELKIEVEGEEGHTLLNVLQKALLDDDTIEMAGYNIPHPLVGNPIMYVHTKGRRKPEAAIRQASKKMQRENREFIVAFKKASEEWQRK